MSKARILFQLSGSIAAYKSCHIISRLVQAGTEVRTACTPNALRFIGTATLEGLTGHPVFTDAYERGRMMDHIHLAKWADLAILCPASANTINRLASGTAEDAVGSLFLAFDLASKPYFVAPAMNEAMFRHPATQASLAKLASWKVRVLPTDTGHQACGDTGPGRLLDPDKILHEILTATGLSGENSSL